MCVIQNPLLGLISGTLQHLREFRDTPHAVIKKQRLSWENLRVPTKEFSSPGEPLRYYRTTGLMITQIQELVRRVNEALDEPWNKRTGRPKSLGLYKAVEANAMGFRAKRH